MHNFDSILERRSIPNADRPALRAILEFGVRPSDRLVAKCQRGAYKRAIDDAMAAITAASCPHKFA